MKYFVTGATGFVGGRVARQLRAAGHGVVALVRAPAKASELAALGVELAQGDITDKESMRAPMRGTDGVFHIAAWYEIGLRDKSMAERINVGGTRNVLELMRELGVPKGVYTSSVAVFGDTHGQLVDETYRAGGPWLTEYDRTKWMAHYEVAEPMQRAGLPLVIVQPGLVYGPGDHSTVHETIVQYLQGKLPMAPRGTSYSWGHVEDVARAHVLAMEKGRTGESYIIGGPVHDFIEVFGMAESITGIPAPRLHPGPAFMKLVANLVGVAEKFVPVPKAYASESLRVIAGMSYLGDNSKARRELGYDPRPLEDGLRETLLYEMQVLGISGRRR